jgi:hypothetical protein
MSCRAAPLTLAYKCLLFTFLCANCFLAQAKDLILRTEANVAVELTLTARQGYADPFNDVTLDVVFLDPQGRELKVPAFWAGGKLWKVRYSSPVTGTHSFRTVCSTISDSGLHGLTGKVIAKPYTGQNPLFIHGPLHLSANHRFLQHADGTPFFWLGDTWWMGLWPPGKGIMCCSCAPSNTIEHEGTCSAMACCIETSLEAAVMISGLAECCQNML